MSLQTMSGDRGSYQKIRAYRFRYALKELLLVTKLVAEEAAVKIKPFAGVADTGHALGGFGHGGSGGLCGLGLFVQCDLQFHLAAAADDGDGGGVTGLEVPQCPGQGGDALDFVAAQIDDDT